MSRDKFKQPSPRFMAHSFHQAWQDIIFDDCAGIVVTIMLFDDRVSVRAHNYAQFVVAKKRLSKLTNLPISFDFLNKLA